MLFRSKFFTGGSFTTDMITWLVRESGELTLEQAHFRLSYLPAQAAGFLDRGFLREGAPADITVLAPSAPVTIRAAELKSKSKNTPFDGWEMRGAAAATIVGGRTVFVNPAVAGAERFQG